MEIQDGSVVALDLNVDSRSYLQETAKWGKFLSIVGFIGCGLMVVLGIFSGSLFSNLQKYNRAYQNTEHLGGILLIIYVLLGIAYFFPCLFLYRYSENMQGALRQNDVSTLTTSFRNLKSLFKYYGIFTIVILGFYALAIIVGVIAASMGGFK